MCLGSGRLDVINNAFAMISIITFVAAVVAVLSGKVIADAKRIESRRFRAAAMMILFVIFFLIGYGVWRSILNAGPPTIRYEETKAQAGHPLMLR